MSDNFFRISKTNKLLENNYQGFVFLYYNNNVHNVETQNACMDDPTLNRYLNSVKTPLHNRYS